MYYLWAHNFIGTASVIYHKTKITKRIFHIVMYLV